MTRRNGLIIMTILVSGWGCQSGNGLSPQAQQQLNGALTAYNAGDDQQTLSCTNVVLVESRKGYGAMQAYYLRGLARLRQGHLSKAAADLRIVHQRVHYESLRLKAADALGEVSYRQGLLKEAEKLFAEVLRDMPAGKKPSDHAGYRMGCILQKDGRWAESRKYFRRVMYEFRGTKLAERSEQRSTAEAWTIQVGAYHQKKHAVDAAGPYKAIGHETYVAAEVRNKTELVYLLLVGRWNLYRQAVASLPAVKKIEPGAFLKVTR